ncbi:MAG TPA: thiol reductant ABC exporter subunit CydC [Pseudoxanthomonas sp.]|nr:thiol reductant ABC exporter subunit CydC [Pseudoxanthomonas sp.]
MNAPPDDLAAVFRRHRRGIALSLLLILLTLLAGVSLLGLAGHFLIAASLAGATALGFNLFGPSAGIRALTFVRILSRYGERLLGHSVTLALARDLRVWFFRRALPLAPLQLGRYRTGELLARLMSDIEAVDGHIVRAWGPLLALGATCGLAVIVALFVLPAAGVLLAALLAVLALFAPWVQRRASANLEQKRAQARAQMRYSILEGLEGAGDLFAFDAVSTWNNRVDEVSATLAARELERKRRLAWGVVVHDVVAAITLPAMAWVLLDAVNQGALTAPAAAGLFFMTVAVLEAAAGASLAWQAWLASRASMRRLQDVVDVAPAMAEGPAAVALEGTLELRHVELTWPGQPRPVLADVSLRLPPGHRIALRGDSGAGKSSLLSLLLRLHAPDAGQLRYADQDLSELQSADWHRRLAWLPQEAPVFAGSMRENLRMGDPLADDDRLWWSLEQVQLAELVRAWPQGLSGWMGEGGATLSAGQARRVALARALLRDAPILLLDEPTEGLDADTAEAVMRNVVAASDGRSMLIITHGSLPPGTVHASWRLIDGRLWPDDVDD